MDVFCRGTFDFSFARKTYRLCTELERCYVFNFFRCSNLSPGKIFNLFHVNTNRIPNRFSMNVLNNDRR